MIGCAPNHGARWVSGSGEARQWTRAADRSVPSSRSTDVIDGSVVVSLVAGAVPLPVHDYIALEARFGAHNYKPLDVVIERAEGSWVFDITGKRYLDRLAAYSAVKRAALDVLTSEGLVEGAAVNGAYVPRLLRTLRHANIKEIRGRGLWLALEFCDQARPYCEALKEEGVLCNDTRERVLEGRVASCQ